MNFSLLKKTVSFLALFCIVSCTTTQKNCSCKQTTQETASLLDENPNAQIPSDLSPTQIFDLAIQLLNNDSPEEALKVLDKMPSSSQNSQYKKLKHDALNKLVMNLRYKVRVLYEKSMQIEPGSRQDLLAQCKKTLESIIKDYPEYDDMYSVKNNLKQIDRELAKKYDARK